MTAYSKHCSICWWFDGEIERNANQRCMHCENTLVLHSYAHPHEILPGLGNGCPGFKRIKIDQVVL